MYTEKHTALERTEVVGVGRGHALLAHIRHSFGLRKNKDKMHEGSAKRPE